jgi:hypothetical protein
MMKRLSNMFRDEIEESPIPVKSAEAMLQAAADFLADLADDDPDYDCPNSLTTDDIIEARAAVMQALAVFHRRH